MTQTAKRIKAWKAKLVRASNILSMRPSAC